MDLWIRSQRSLRLKKVDDLSIYNKEGENISFIMDASSRFVLGEYETEERALEVLDEITHYIDGTIYDMKNRTCVFYEMPKE